MMEKKCNFCSSTSCERKKIDYLYSYKGNYLLVPDTPVEICSECGMIYYDAKVLKSIEEHFFAIQSQKTLPDNYIEIPSWAYTG